MPGWLLILLASGCGKQPSSDAQAATRLPAPRATPAVVHPEVWPAVTRPAIDDSAIEARLNDLLGSLSVEEKVGQIVQADVSEVTPADVLRYRLGSILSGGNSSPTGDDDLAPASAWLAAADAFYAASMDTREGRHAIPILWGVDAVHGHNNIIGATLFPHNVALGATRNPDLIRRIGEVTARELRITGQEWTFAPTIAVAQDVRWGRAYESYSEDPSVVRDYAAAIVKGLQGEVGSPDFLRGDHVIATAKHYLADGGTFEGRDQGDARASEEVLRDVHGAGYPAAIAAGVQAVMASFSSWQGEKIHGHKGLLTDVLKQRMGFEGFVVGDWNAHGQVRGCTTFSCAQSINAGLDMFMAPDSWKQLYVNTLAQVRSGEIPIARLDDAVRRILRVKLRAGLFEAGKPSSRGPGGRFDLLGAPEHRAVARQAVRESLVLLKNVGDVLPLHPKMRVLVAGDGADNIPKQNGGWTLTWQGTGITNAHFPKAQSIYAGIREVVIGGGGSVELSPSGSFKNRPDVAIVVFGEDPYAEFQGDVDTLEYKPGDKSDVALLRKLKSADIPVVAVFLSGRPMWVNPELNASDAFVAAWLPGSEGGGVADVLFRSPDGNVRHEFKGKLPFSWPGTPLQTTTSPGKQPFLFPLGFGLTYADRRGWQTLSEVVPPRPEAASVSRTYFAAGKPGKGWTVAVGEQGEKRAALPTSTGGTASGALRLTAIDRSAQEDARLASWSGSAPATLSIESPTPVDLQREANGELSLVFDFRVDAAPTGAVALAVECGERCRGELPIETHLRQAPTGEWRQLKVPLRCFEHSGADMRKITAPFSIASASELRLGLANIRLDTGLNGALSCD
jgi:beta-glucosidase